MVSARQLVAELFDSDYLAEANFDLRGFGGMFLWGPDIKSRGLFIRNIKGNIKLLSYLLGNDFEEKLAANGTPTVFDIVAYAVTNGYSVIWKVGEDVFAAGTFPLYLDGREGWDIFTIFKITELDRIYYYGNKLDKPPRQVFASEVIYGKSPKRLGQGGMFGGEEEFEIRDYSGLATGKESQPMVSPKGPRRLGLTVDQDPNNAKRFVVSAVADGSLAQQAGIRPGDVILTIKGFYTKDGEYVGEYDVSTLDDIRDIVTQAAKNQEIVITIQRQGKQYDVTLSV
jgi:hypothetical protein